VAVIGSYVNRMRLAGIVTKYEPTFSTVDSFAAAILCIAEEDSAKICFGEVQ